MRRRRDAVIALSLSNLVFFKVWAAYFYSYHRPYFRQDVAPGLDYLAILLDVLLLAALFWVGAQLARRSDGAALLAGMRLLFLVTLLVVASVIARGLQPTRGPFATEPAPWSWAAVLVAAGAGLAALYFAVRWQRPLARAGVHLVLVLSPFVLVTGAQAVWMARPQPPAAAVRPGSRPPALPRRSPDAPRVLWLVFDGLDQRLAFDERPAGLALPEFDRLRGESLVASRALPISTATLVSLPSLLTGRIITYCDPQGPDELMIYTEGSPAAVPWSRQPTVFSRARALGVESGLAGWFHPYCRLFGSQLETCASWPFRFAGGPRSLPVRLRDVAAMMLWSLPLTDQFFFVDPLGLDLFPTRSFRGDHRRKHEGILAAARAMAADPALGLVFVHSPMPHGPGIYDRRAGKLGAPADPKEWYLDNLALADRTLGELRQALEQAGLAERTAIVVTADHSWGASASFDGKRDPRVPLLVRLPGQTQALRSDAELRITVLHDLVLAVLRGELKKPDEVARWLNERGKEAKRQGGRE